MKKVELSKLLLALFILYRLYSTIVFTLHEEVVRASDRLVNKLHPWMFQTNIMMLVIGSVVYKSRQKVSPVYAKMDKNRERFQLYLYIYIGTVRYFQFYVGGV
jgi:hypothetical protein